MKEQEVHLKFGGGGVEMITSKFETGNWKMTLKYILAKAGLSWLGTGTVVCSC